MTNKMKQKMDVLAKEHCEDGLDYCFHSEDLQDSFRKGFQAADAEWRKIVEVLVENLEWFTNHSLYEMTSYMTSPLIDLNNPENTPVIRVEGNPILNMGFEKAKQALEQYRKAVGDE